jgi:hypothetical protein
MALTAKRALYIKLGEGDKWADLSFQSNTLRFGFHKFSHERTLKAARDRDFTPVKEFYESEGVAPGTATRYSNEVREFYTAGDDVLWITFSNGAMWWCFAEDEVIPTLAVDSEAEGYRFRKTKNSWSNKDQKGETLRINALRGSLTATAGFRGTICRVKEFDYLLRRLNGEVTPETEAVDAARRQLIESLKPLICGLHPKDFELLVELVMTQSGWRRVSATGGIQKTTDIELKLPLTDEHAFVQIKSRLDQITTERIVDDLKRVAEGQRVFIAYHTGSIKPHIENDNVILMGPDKLAEHVVDLGLTTWVMAKVG